MQVALNGAGGNVELHVKLRHVGPLIGLGRVGVLDREILHILRNDPGGGHGVFAIGGGAGVIKRQV